MFLIVCKYDGRDYVVDLVKSIRAHGHNDLVVIVDSDSQDFGYIPKLKDSNVVVCLIKNTGYVDGAVWWAYENFANEKFFYVLHDSMLLHKNLSEYEANKFTSIMKFFGGWHDDEEQAEYIKSSLAGIGLEYNHDYQGLFGITFFCQRQVLDELKALGLNKIIPRKNVQMRGSERIWGFCLKKIGIDVGEHCIKGEFHNDDTPEIIQKFIAHRE
jgi:hypothetical protein